MGSIKTVLLLSLLVTTGVAGATPLVSNRNSEQEQEPVFDLREFSPDSESSDAQTQIEQASQEFDAFALQMPLVIKAKLQAFMKHGFKAILMEDSTTKPAEEKMIRSLTNGLRNIGAALEDDMANYEQARKGDGENKPGFGSEYHNSSPPSRSVRNGGH
jgi:hypothetical protein